MYIIYLVYLHHTCHIYIYIYIYSLFMTYNLHRKIKFTITRYACTWGENKNQEIKEINISTKVKANVSVIVL